MKFLAGLMSVFAVYLAWWAVSSGAWWWALPAIASFAGSIGLFKQKRWAQYIWHTITVSMCTIVVLNILIVAKRGWPYETLEESLISLLPGLMVLAICIGGSIAIAKHSQRASNALTRQ